MVAVAVMAAGAVMAVGGGCCCWWWLLLLPLLSACRCYRVLLLHGALIGQSVFAFVYMCDGTGTV